MAQLASNTTRYKIPFFMFIAAIALAIWLLLRLVLWVDVGVSQIPFGTALKADGLGLWFDVNALCFLLVPFLLGSLLIPNNWRTKAWLNKACWLLAFLVTFGLLFGAVSEYIFWQEFTTRFNFIAVDYLIYTSEVIGNIRESYPVPLILLIIALVGLVILFALHRFVSFDTAALSLKKKVSYFSAAIALPVLSFQLGNVDQMEFSKNSYANELAGNGIFSFSAAAHRNELDYDKFYKTIPQALAFKTLLSVGSDRKPTSEVLAEENDAQQHRSAELGPFKRHPKNVVLISVESLSAEYLGTYGNKEHLTPYLDKLAGESLVFDK
ncbi:MAG: LTA synthase family protein, partial [Methylotenera sp.]